MNPEGFRTILLEKLKFRAASPISQELAETPGDVDVVLDYLRRQWMVMATWAIPGKEWTFTVGTESVPDGWWQAFKHEVFPAWLQRRFTVRMREIEVSRTIIKTCPALGPWPSQEHRHWEFFEEP